ASRKASREPLRDDSVPIQLSTAAEEVLLANLNAVVAQDRVSGRVVEVEVRRHEVEQVVLAREVEGRMRELELDRAGLGALELLGLERLQMRDGFRDALVKIAEGLLFVGPLGRILPGKAARAAL